MTSCDPCLRSDATELGNVLRHVMGSQAIDIKTEPALRVKSILTFFGCKLQSMLRKIRPAQFDKRRPAILPNVPLMNRVYRLPRKIIGIPNLHDKKGSQDQQQE